MKRGKLTILFLTLVLLLSSCGGEAARGESTYVLYFRSTADSGPALAAQPCESETAPNPQDMLAALLAGPTEEGFASPFPARVSLLHWEWDEETPGHLRVWLSEQYGGLTDISLTLADYCIVLTLSQLDGVESVEILSQGLSTNYRSHQIMKAEEALLADEVAG